MCMETKREWQRYPNYDGFRNQQHIIIFWWKRDDKDKTCVDTAIQNFMKKLKKLDEDIITSFRKFH